MKDLTIGWTKSLPKVHVHLWLSIQKDTECMTQFRFLKKKSKEE